MNIMRWIKRCNNCNKFEFICCDNNREKWITNVPCDTDGNPYCPDCMTYLNPIYGTNIIDADTGKPMTVEPGKTVYKPGRNKPQKGT